MIKNKLALSLTSLSLLLLPVLASAQPTVSVTDLPSFVAKIESAIWVVFGLIAVICFIYAAILFMTAGGAPEKVQALDPILQRFLACLSMSRSLCLSLSLASGSHGESSSPPRQPVRKTTKDLSLSLSIAKGAQN